MGKSLLVLLLAAFCFSEPQVMIGLGKTAMSGTEFKLPANTAIFQFTPNSAARLQFGLQYETTTAIVNKNTFYNCSGLLFTNKLILATHTQKSPYFGFNFGWLNSTLSSSKIIYNARGSFTGEALAGYTFRLDDETRLNIEYQNRYIELKYEEKPLQRSQTVLVYLAWLLTPALEPLQPKITPADTLANKKEYLTNKLNYNNQEMQKYDLLIQKYNLRLENEINNDKLLEEKNYLIQQKNDLEKENIEIQEQLKNI